MNENRLSLLPKAILTIVLFAACQLTVADFLPTAVEIDSLPAEKETWGDHLVTQQDVIPSNAFLAVYFRKSNPREIVYSESVPKISISYPWSEFHDIKAEDFSAYWVGDFDFPQDERRELHVSQSWSQSRVLIDRRIVYDGGESVVLPLRFKQGRHRVEVQYVNNWHTVDFAAKLLKTQKAGSALPPKPTNTSAIWYVGVYQSSDRSSNIRLRLQPAQTPVYLFLSSYSPVTWRIESSPGTQLAGVYYSSYEPGTEIELADAAVPTVSVPLGPTIFPLKPSCSEYGGLMSCEQGLYVGDKLKQWISNLTGGIPPSGF